MGDIQVKDPTVTVIFPVDAPIGTDVVIEVAVADFTVAEVPLNLTVLLDEIVLKFVPVIVTVAPTSPDTGVKLVIVGTGNVASVTVNVEDDVAVRPLTVTEIAYVFPTVKPVDGTMTVSDVVVALIIVAATVPKLTVLFEIAVSKFFPVIITDEPI